MQDQSTTWHKKKWVIIPILLGIIVGFLPTVLPLNWAWILVCWMVWGSCTIWLILILSSSKTLRVVVLILTGITLVIGGLHRVEEQWLKDHPTGTFVYRLPVNHLPEPHREPAADEAAQKPAPDQIAQKPPAEPSRNDDLSHQKQEIRPVVKVKAIVTNSPNQPAFYSVSNEGPIDVLQLKTQVLSHKMHKDGEIGTAGYEETYVEKLTPQTSASYYFPEHCLDVNKTAKESAGKSILEIRLTYSYGPDMKNAVKSAFYFVNPKGVWVEESDKSLTPKIYNPIKKSLEMLLHAERS
jgi:hypothetical protein